MRYRSGSMEKGNDTWERRGLDSVLLTFSAALAENSPSATLYRSMPNTWFQPSGISNGRGGCAFAISRFAGTSSAPGPDQTWTMDSLKLVKTRSSWYLRKEAVGASLNV